MLNGNARLLIIYHLIGLLIILKNEVNYAEQIERTYYPNGSIRTESCYKNGLLNGVFRRYYDDGSLWEEANFVDGKLEGSKVTYYKNGVVQAVVVYQGGSMTQCWLFNTKGQLITNSCLALTLQWKYGSFPYPLRKN